MTKPGTGLLWLVLAMAAPAAHAAQDPPPSRALKDAHAFLQGLSPDGDRPEADGNADVYYSIVENPEAPRLVNRLEIAVNPCRTRTISALQFPGQWAIMSFTITDLTRITHAVAYGSVDDLIAERNPIAVSDPRAQQIVLTGNGLQCTSRLSLEGKGAVSSCGNRLDIEMIDPDQVDRGRKALAIATETCNIDALRK